MKKKLLILLVCFLSSLYVFGEEQANEVVDKQNISLSMVFYNFGWNALHSITYNNGLNFIGAGLGTWVFIESELDWKWNRLAYNNSWMPDIGGNANYIGYVVPVITPLTLYFTGLAKGNEKLQITGMALTQTLILTMAIQTPLKITTGRTWPGIVDGWDSPMSIRSERTDNYSGEFNWFIFDAIGGWPSGHTANAFAAAATISQIYHENTLLKVMMFSYASLIGIGMSMYDHWASDVFSGALIGYAIGTVVGKSYSNYLGNKSKINKITFFPTMNGINLNIRF